MKEHSARQAQLTFAMARHALVDLSQTLGLVPVSVPQDRLPTERYRLILNLLRPHIDLARQNADLLTARSELGDQQRTTYDLTPRETEVAGWLAAGKANPEIAIILASNVRTVEKHVEAVLKKLGVENRTAAAVLILAGEHARNGC